MQTVEAPLNTDPMEVSPEIQEFAITKGIRGYLNAVIDLARRSFPSARLAVAVGKDAEDETHQYIALDVDASGLTSTALLNGQRAWSAGIVRICPPRYAVYFVLGWQ